MDSERDLFQKQVRELADRSYRQMIYTNTDFLTLEQQSWVYEMERELSFVPWELWGGTQSCERRILRFGSESLLGYEMPWPIDCLTAEPLQARFSDDLTHRDYLGALMHLGIRREMLGDIIVREHAAYIFCLDHMSDFVMSELGTVRHTSMRLKKTEQVPADAAPKLSEESFVVASERLDALVAKACRMSRSAAADLIHGKKVFLNGRLAVSSSAAPAPGTAVSVRGVGKFIYIGKEADTRKGNIRVSVGHCV